MTTLGSPVNASTQQASLASAAPERRLGKSTDFDSQQAFGEVLGRLRSKAQQAPDAAGGETAPERRGGLAEAASLKRTLDGRLMTTDAAHERDVGKSGGDGDANAPEGRRANAGGDVAGRFGDGLLAQFCDDAESAPEQVGANTPHAHEPAADAQDLAPIGRRGDEPEGEACRRSPRRSTGPLSDAGPSNGTVGDDAGASPRPIWSLAADPQDLTTTNAADMVRATSAPPERWCGAPAPSIAGAPRDVDIANSRRRDASRATPPADDASASKANGAAAKTQNFLRGARSGDADVPWPAVPPFAPGANAAYRDGASTRVGAVDGATGAARADAALPNAVLAAAPPGSFLRPGQDGASVRDGAGPKPIPQLANFAVAARGGASFTPAKAPFASLAATTAEGANADGANRLNLTILDRQTHLPPTGVHYPPIIQLGDAIVAGVHDMSGAASPNAVDAPAPDLANAKGAGVYTAIRSLDLQLEPENLGRVTIRLRLSGERLDVQIDATQPEAANLIRDDEARLAHRLRAAGYAIGHLDVKHGVDDGAGAANVLGAGPASPVAAPQERGAAFASSGGSNAFERRDHFSQGQSRNGNDDVEKPSFESGRADGLYL
ncbi:flagellar hook-length control protein FliK [Methylocella sp.]|uniref:flagellar hook-length control protein FliK n=1 Tax=Methylocella sp. TaxID=1978226 RepID=UPI003782E410